MSSISAPGSWGISYGTADLSPGLLIGINVAVDAVWQGQYGQFWACGIVNPANVVDGSVMTLLTGYAYYPAGLSWTGLYEILPGERLYFYTVGLRVQSATISTRRLTLTRNGSFSEFFSNIISSAQSGLSGS